ncbi:MAG: aminomethyl-transferring glycine dehydrogenase subunit GcvPB [Nitrospinae bacterium]|nr:aminomethyl-transferring glycine dehydrogenase subunit GcvPB [Nitrospinota bacterium]
MTQAQRGLVFQEKEIFGRGSSGRNGVDFPNSGIPAADISALAGADYIRSELKGFPELSEPEVIRHYTRLSQWNYGVDSNIYPLGSCTMKHNPRVNEAVSRLKGFAGSHPLQPDSAAQGTLKMIYDLGRWLCEIVGMDAATLQPAAGAHGEFTGLLMIRAALAKRGNARQKVLLPDSAHGTNPASSVYCGYQAVTIKSGPDGKIDLVELDRMMDDSVAALMVTNPNTLGVFESDIMAAAKIVHDRGGFVYADGANLSALIGKTRFGDLGIDVCHINLHKTFSTPHGGGGPGAGPVCVKKELEPFLPVPVVMEKDGKYTMDNNMPDSVGRVHGFHGNVGVLLRAAAYILSMGPQGLKEATEAAVINANYIKARLKDYYHTPIPGHSLHECVFNDKIQSEGNHISTLDIAKGLIDRGFHPPTIYFPLIVKGALMIEPTETESREALDAFCEAMIDIAEKAKSDPESLHQAPVNAVRRRLDEAQAARNPELRCSICG